MTAMTRVVNYCDQFKQNLENVRRSGTQTRYFATGGTARRQ